MAEKDENSLIGYDPLAWMLEPNQDQQMPTAPVVMPEVDQIIEEQVSAEMHAEQDVVDSQSHETAFESADDMSSAGVAKIELEPVLSIQHVGQLHERLQEALERFDKIEIDASAVSTVDTSTLQLLLIAKRTAIKHQKNVIIDFPSDRFIEACDLLGISEMLGVDQAAAGFF